MKDDWLINLAAQSMANTFIAELLLAQYLKAWPADARKELAEALVKSASVPTTFQGAPLPFDDAVSYADIEEKMRLQLAVNVRRALDILGG